MIEYTPQHESAYYYPAYITDLGAHLRQIQMYCCETKRTITVALQNTKFCSSLNSHDNENVSNIKL
jgi:hypothetical protein